MTYFDTIEYNFKDVEISADKEINTSEFLQATAGLVKLFDLLGSTAFSVVQSDMNGNIKKIRTRQEALGEAGKSLQQVVLNEAAQKTKDATQGLLWLTRGLQFTYEAMKRNLDNPDEELATSFTKAYGETLSKYHSFVVRPVFKLAMNACPYRKDFYMKLGSPLETVQKQLAEWLAALGRIVEIIQTFLASGNYAKGL